MMVIGIDPGATGGFAVMNGNEYLATPLPMSGKEVNAHMLTRYLNDRHEFNPFVFVEQQQCFGISGKASMFKLGQNYGTILGVLGAIGMRTMLVAPKAWKADVLKGTPKDKDAAVAFCGRYFPQASLLLSAKHSKPHDGMADALCIAEYGRRQLTTTSPCD